MTKIIKNSIITVLFTLIVLTIFPSTAFAKEYVPRLTAPNGEPYYTSELNIYSQTGYAMPNCVAYAYGRIYEITGEKPLINRGNAGEWWFINKYNDYYDYGNEPKLGAVACWSNHVAVVESIADDGAVTVSESHWGGTYFNTAVYYDMTSHYGQSFYGYIYTCKSDSDLALEIDEKLKNEQEEPSYKMEDNTTELQEKNCFNILEFSQSKTNILNPNNNMLLNK